MCIRKCQPSDPKYIKCMSENPSLKHKNTVTVMKKTTLFLPLSKLSPHYRH